MNDIIEKLKKIAKESPLNGFNWPFPTNCPINIPENINDDYNRNIYLKDNFHFHLGQDSTLSSHYWAIQTWGGIGAFRRNEINDNRIRNFVGSLENNCLTRDYFSCISSLSKVASFLKPDEYFIYDSRVIYSLNWLLFNYSTDQALFPQPSGRSASLAKYDIQTIFRLTNRQLAFRSYDVAFHEYCSLIKKLSPEVFGDENKPYRLEMLLFMAAPNWIIKNIENSVTVEIKPL
jgi:hypothetical protein